MPAATSFAALEKGNGFPFCVDKLDVSDYSAWITLGGTEKGNSPSQGEINLSLKNAMKLFWNYNGHTVALLPDNIEIEIDIEGGDYNLKFPTDTEWANPLSRVCMETWLVRNNNTSSSESLVSVRSLKRMYDGSTDNENNFVGYGITFAFNCSFSGFIFNFSSTYTGSIPSPSHVTVQSTTLDGIPFIGIALQQSGSYDSSISGQTATYSKEDAEDLIIDYRFFNPYTY
mgnify:CR=1 FL=1|tara:strand:+ start:60 stop:746 length:687 start_codon:yes stop_codon:yes gene_type:complete